MKIFITLLITNFLLLIATIKWINNQTMKFHNLNPKYKPKGLLELLKWKATTKRSIWPKQVLLENTDIPPNKINDKNKIRVSVVGHATFFIQTNGLNIITDPVWSKRASPFSFLGPKRVIEPGIELKNLPKVDFLILSHNHYDHMDIATIRTLWERDQPKIIVPLLNDKILKKQIKNIKVTTLNWYEKVVINPDISINLEPSQHWSARGIFDVNKSLWGNFIITTPIGDICFIGDSGYNEKLYTELGNKYNIFLSIVPIGAFAPRWFMQDVHLDPEEATKVHQHLKSKFSIASHFQTFPLGSDHYLQAAEELTSALKKNQISRQNFITPTIGKSYLFENNYLFT